MGARVQLFLLGLTSYSLSSSPCQLATKNWLRQKSVHENYVSKSAMVVGAISSKGSGTTDVEAVYRLYEEVG